ncbi:MAG: ATP-binding cassette domain-containing protein [Longimicrobiales bacterium]
MLDKSGRPDIALEARDVTKRYSSTPVLQSLSLVVASGERVALVGESGAGKTTLLKAFNRMVRPDEGTLHVGGRDVMSLSAVKLRRSIGYVQQDGGLLPHWTVLRNVALVPWLRRMDDRREMARDALNQVGLEAAEFGHRYPRELSGGERQRVALARALACRPDTVLLDEPFGALDAITRSELLESVRSLFREIGVTALMVTHDLRAAVRFADRVAVLRNGKIDQVADPETLCRLPATAYVEELLARAGVELGK